MRTLCLNLNTTLEASCAEAFLTLSPRIQFRDPHTLFIDVGSTLGLLGGEPGALKKALRIAADLGARHATAAIAAQPYSAQILLASGAEPLSCATDQERLSAVPLRFLTDLEGLEPWSQPQQIRMITSFLQSLGLRDCGQVLTFPLATFRERWGATGVKLWRRLHQQEEQPLSVWIPVDPLLGYVHFEPAISLLPLLLNEVEKVLRPLFLRLEGLQKFARRLEFSLHCEYSQKVHHLHVEPVSPNRDLTLYLDLTQARLAKLDFENPIKEMEITIFEQAEKIQQLDFFAPRDSSEDRWRRLLSLVQQSGAEMGFLQPEPSHFPERSFTLLSDWPQNRSVQDYIQQIDTSVQVRFAYSKNLAKSPRPSLLLPEPQLLPSHQVQQLRFLQKHPSERIESSWWEYFRTKPTEDHRSRDYYFAMSREGQLLWLFQDCETKAYYLHGYFD